MQQNEGGRPLPWRCFLICVSASTPLFSFTLIFSVGFCKAQVSMIMRMAFCGLSVASVFRARRNADRLEFQNALWKCLRGLNITRSFFVPWCMDKEGVGINWAKRLHVGTITAGFWSVSYGSCMHYICRIFRFADSVYSFLLNACWLHTKWHLTFTGSRQVITEFVSICLCLLAQFSQR